jgi:hypothetical protein
MASMPALPGAEVYEEPYRLGGGSRTFSPPGLEVRNSSVQPPIQTARLSRQTHYFPITDASPATAIELRGAMLECYNNTVATHSLTTVDKSRISDVTKNTSWAN